VLEHFELRCTQRSKRDPDESVVTNPVSQLAIAKPLVFIGKCREQA